MGSRVLHKEAERRQVKHYMKKKVITITKKENLLHAAKKMAKHKIGSLVVIEHSKPVGIVTQGDYLRKVVIEEQLPHKHLIQEVMTKTIRSLPEDADLVSAYKLMRKYRIDHFPVINKTGKLIGIVSEKELLDGMTYIIGQLDWKLVRTKIAFSQFEEKLEEVDVV
jgi:CBS domain-containing protein